MTKYVVSELIGNYSARVFECEDWHEAMNYLSRRWVDRCDEIGDMNSLEYEIEYQNFMSYFCLTEEEK